MQNTNQTYQTAVSPQGEALPGCDCSKCHARNRAAEAATAAARMSAIRCLDALESGQAKHATIGPTLAGQVESARAAPDFSAQG